MSPAELLTRGRLGPVAAALALALGLAGLYLALGGASYQPLDVADPCEPRTLEAPEGAEGALQAIALSALDGAACELGVAREELALALADPAARAAFAAEHGIDEEQIEVATEQGLLRAVDDAERLGLVSGFAVTLLRQAVEVVPIGLLIDALEAASGEDPIGLLTDLLGRLG
ncbi:MAG: hypothetical protein ACRDKX_00980 [Solirubrobacterales bacterium]